MEKAQRRGTKCIPGMVNKSYIERLETLKLPSIEFRRLRGDAIETFKFIHNIYKAE